MEESKTVTLPLMKLMRVADWWMYLDNWLFMYLLPVQVLVVSAKHIQMLQSLWWCYGLGLYSISHSEGYYISSVILHKLPFNLAPVHTLKHHYLLHWNHNYLHWWWICKLLLILRQSIGLLHWWAPLRAKQLACGCYLFLKFIWLGRKSMLASK